MFGFLTSSRSKARKQATHWLDLASTVWPTRRDLLAPQPAEAANFCQRQAGADPPRRGPGGRAGTGARHPRPWKRPFAKSAAPRYPRSALAENVEFFLVAAIAILGFRTYFFQPMVIPTNSMWPSYFGHDRRQLPSRHPAPGPALRLLRLAAFHAVRKEMDAPESGEVSAPVMLDADGQPHLLSFTVPGRSWLVFPANAPNTRCSSGVPR